MRRRQLFGLVLASALITLDGTATTVALPAIGRDLSASMAELQWVVNAPLLVLAALLLPAGVLADGYGRRSMIVTGLMVFVAASVACATATSPFAVVAAKFVQGAGGALVLPACLAALRTSYTDALERTRILGLWAAATGAAAAAGPLLAGALVDLWSWRAVFLPPAALGGVALLLLVGKTQVPVRTSTAPLPRAAILGLVMLIGVVAYLLMHASTAGLGPARLAGALSLAVLAVILLVRDRHRHVLFPRELLTARNCVSANATTFALYFGLFGVSFLLVLYVQQVLRLSASWAGIVLLPSSMMMLFAERFARGIRFVGTRSLMVAGAVAAAAGIAVFAASTHPIPVWPHMIVGTALFGLGISIAVSGLTHAAVAAVPESCAGAASGLNHAVVRIAGLAAVALLGWIATPTAANAVSAEGVQRAMAVCAGVVGIGGVFGSALLRDDEPGGVEKAS